MENAALFGGLSVLMMLASRGTYFASILRGQTRPHAFSWLIWGTISTIGFAAQYVDGAGAGSWARGFGAVTCFVLVVMGILHGEKNITRSDWTTLAVALLAVPLWVVTKTPFWSVVLVCLIDTVGYIPTLRKSWLKPREESAKSYVFSCLGAFFSLVAIEHYTPTTWLYPAVLTVTNGSMAAFLLGRRRVGAAVPKAV